jgi:hypothetical protein
LDSANIFQILFVGIIKNEQNRIRIAFRSWLAADHISGCALLFGELQWERDGEREYGGL